MKSCSDCKERPQYIHMLTVEKQGTATNAAGQLDPSDSNWSTVFRLMGRIITKGGREHHVFKQTAAETQMVIMTLYTSKEKIPDPSWRIRYDGRKFNITEAYRVDESGDEVLIGVSERRQP